MIPYDKDCSSMGNFAFAQKNINHPLDKIFGDMTARWTDFLRRFSDVLPLFQNLLLPLALQIIFPEGGDVPQPLNDGREMFNDVVHLFFGIIDGEAEADGTVGRCKGNAHRPENMRRFE
jgi:hypothetical protein